MVVNIGFEWTRKEDDRQTKINEVLVQQRKKRMMILKGIY